MTALPRIRPAEPADQDALAALDALAWSPESGFPSVIESARAGPFFTAANPPEAHLVAEAGGRLVGYIRIKAPTPLPENAHVLQVQGLAVHPSARHRGVASALLAAAERQAGEHGARKLSLRVLSTNKPAIRVYERLGFAREGVLIAEFRIAGADVDDVLMAKHLGRAVAAAPAALSRAAAAGGQQVPAGVSRAPGADKPSSWCGGSGRLAGCAADRDHHRAAGH